TICGHLAPPRASFPESANRSIAALGWGGAQCGFTITQITTERAHKPHTRHLHIMPRPRPPAPDPASVLLRCVQCRRPVEVIGASGSSISASADMALAAER